MFILNNRPTTLQHFFSAFQDVFLFSLIIICIHFQVVFKLLLDHALQLLPILNRPKLKKHVF